VGRFHREGQGCVHGGIIIPGMLCP
jgi:hypothetical protein